METEPAPQDERGWDSPAPRALVVAVVIGLVVAVAGMWWLATRSDSGAPLQPAEAARPVTPRDLDRLARVVQRALVAGTSAPTPRAAGRLGQRTGPTFVVLRDGGARVGSAWGEGDTALAATVAAVVEARTTQGAATATVDTVEVCLSHSYRRPTGNGLPGDVDVGVLGLRVDHEDDAAAYSPTLMLADNWDFDDALTRFADAYDVPTAALTDADHLQVFGCDQVLVRLGDRPRARLMQRGNTLVTMGQVDRRGVAQLGERLGRWLTHHVHPDGRMTYEYWPSRGEESTSTNTIRQWMATIALNRYARDHGGDRAVYRLAARNIRYNLRTYYEEEGRLGLVVEPSDGDVKLGAVALAALAIKEHPRRREWAREEAALRRTVDSLWRDDGSFATFHRPAGRTDNQNFYPGEALLLWAELYQDSRDPELLSRFMRSFTYYRDWHLQEENRNPAFVPWHTQAYAQLWRVTRDRRLLDFVFEMNDWLLGLQQWDDAERPDVRGRFYDPDRPQFGVPHASSTGVYLEGLAEAHRLAVLVGDDTRRERYWLAIRRGLRDVMQLQLVDDVDMFYVPRAQRDDVRGGIRTEVYDNVIRVDNVQHNLLAVLNILRWWPGR